MITRSKARIFKPKVCTNQVHDKLAKIEPLTVDEALLSNSWKKAMQEEYNALMKNKTWTLVPMKIIDNKWVCRLKYDLEGRVHKQKARLVVRGFLQSLRVDFGETFNLVIKASTLKFTLTLAMYKDWQIKQVDVNNAFLNGKLNVDNICESGRRFCR